MTTPPSRKLAARKKPKARKFYIMLYAFHARPDFEIENLEVLGVGPQEALGPPPGRRGFPAYPENPRVVIGKRKEGPPPKDLELFHDYWLVSDRLKLVFEAVDREAFAFQACDVFLRDGSSGPTYWLCDVVRTLEPFSKVTLDEIERRKDASFLLTIGQLEFNEAVIGGAHIFRTPYTRHDIFCDRHVKDACKAAGIKGAQYF